MKKAISNRFTPIEGPEENLSHVMAARLDPKELLSSLIFVERLFEKAGFNKEAKFGLLRYAVMEHMNLAQFVMYR